jgi:GNAT superfamily N-acetyltransferase
MRERMRSPFWKVMIAELEGVAVATYTAQALGLGVVRLAYMVAEGYRLRGIGKALILAALETMPRSYVELVIDEKNTASIRTAQACGFEERFGGVAPGFVRYTKVTS